MASRDFPARLALAVILFFGLFAAAPAFAESTEGIDQRHPYVIGASVSMGMNLFGRGHSPSLYALKQLGYEREIIVKKTVITGSFRRKFQWLRESFKDKPPEIVMAIDLFHHDTRAKDEIPEETYQYMRDMIEFLCEPGVPVIIGTIWTRYENESTIAEVNQFLNKEAGKHDNLHLFPAGALLDGITKEERYFEYDVDDVSLLLNRKRGSKLLLDVVHPNGDGARLMANLLIDILNRIEGNATSYYDVSDVVKKLTAIPISEIPTAGASLPDKHCARKDGC